MQSHEVLADGRTSCCGAFTSISIDDDGMEYCKACYEEVSNPDPFTQVIDTEGGSLSDAFSAERS